MIGRSVAAAGIAIIVIALAWKPLLSSQDMSTNYYLIETRLGNMVVMLYDDTPLHRDNFRKLVEEQFYDSTTFHRIIAGFMIQGGDPNSRDDDPMNDGQGGPGYTIPAEFNQELLHRRGALAAARQGDNVNPEKRSSGSQFYIVHGSPLDSTRLSTVEQEIRNLYPSFSYSDADLEHYQSVGGAPFLDMQYTVFGELVEGHDVLDAIAGVDTPKKFGRGGPLADRPLEPVVMSIRPLPDYTPDHAQ